MKHTILSHLKRGNISGIALHKNSLLSEVKPLLLELCIKMAKIGETLTEENVIALATELIEGTEHATQLEEFKKKTNLEATGTDGETTLGVCWYKNFMARNKGALKQGKCKAKDQKRCT
jgi:hypothetical protein